MQNVSHFSSVCTTSECHCYGNQLDGYEHHLATPAQGDTEWGSVRVSGEMYNNL
ncbi:hypothetical protein DPMN_029993 [Dreissena polymorpha]|uniref:Uncharacterized protein n=1 Tax=Dreissena polymorpha TaxID=45954 RepID=A0A9D4LXE4_DREPO|nr:hypothetical protein DPMN_183798 [Dreissena polymorpha]KAH3866870.1 hypothetical protein DPMN_029993 [Dreissena polymorpha]